MRGIGPLAAVLLAALALTGCGGGDGGDDSGRSSATGGGGMPVETTDPREEFLSALAEAEFESWAVDAPTDDEIAAFPEKWCRAAAAGHSVGWMLEGEGSDELYPIGWTWGTEISDAEQVVIMGIMTHCPDRQADAIASLRDGGIDY